MKRLLAAALVLGLAFPSQLEGQNRWEDQVRSLLSMRGGSVAGSGFSSTGAVYTGALDEDQEGDIWMTLQAGATYAIVGVCDEDCSDVDLFLYAENGDEIDSDVSIDEIPRVEVSPGYTGEFRVRVRMYSCETEPCYYAVGVYERGGGGGGAGVAAGGYAEQTRGFLNNAYARILAERGYQASGQIYEGALSEDGEEDVWVTLEQGRSYAILGVCDVDCSDVDLYLYDAGGSEIDSDVSIDDEPVVNATPRSNGDFRVRVRMYNCETEPCFYAVGVYVR